MSRSALSHRISIQVLQDILSGDISSGAHLAAQQVAERYGVSRTPVRDALAQLEAQGVLRRHQNRGFFVAESVPEEVRDWLDGQQGAAADEYHQLADDWLTDRLPEEVSEQFLRQTYGWTKSKVSDVLTRATREGWAERKEGYGWRFLAVAKTAEAYGDIYRFRMAIEPAALLEPNFEIDRAVLEDHRRIQERMVDADLSRIPAERLLDNGSAFHESLARMSGNPFFPAALERVNRMRRLMEYRTELNRERFAVQCGEHLELIDLLMRGEIVEASYFMRRHLAGALRRKAPMTREWTEGRDRTK